MNSTMNHKSNRTASWLNRATYLSACLFTLCAMAAPRVSQADVAYNPANGHVYGEVWFYGNWDEANAMAQTLTHNGRRGHLATITSAVENQFIAAALPDAVGNAFWLGGFQAPDEYSAYDNWQWVTGEPFTYSNWSWGEPNDIGGPGSEQQLRFWGGGGVWNDEHPMPALGFVVEYDPFELCLLYDPNKLHKAGSTVPIKLQICSAGTNASSSSVVLHAVSLQKVGGADPGTPVDSGNANPDSDFRYDATLGETGGYIFNLSTKGLATGEYMLSFTAGGDSTQYSVTFQIK